MAKVKSDFVITESVGVVATKTHLFYSDDTIYYYTTDKLEQGPKNTAIQAKDIMKFIRHKITTACEMGIEDSYRHWNYAQEAVMAILKNEDINNLKPSTLHLIASAIVYQTRGEVMIRVMVKE